MILLIISYALILSDGKYIDKISRKNIKFYQEIRYNITDCIEKCTSFCLTDTNIYTCFDHCTLKECITDAAFINENNDTFANIVKLCCLILFVLFFVSVICYNRILKSNDNYWLL